MRQPLLRKARVMWMIERQIRGDSVKDIAKELGLSEQTISREIKRGAEKGYVEKVRDKLLATLDAAPNVYAEILDPETPVEKLHKLSRGYKLRLDAANSLAEGLGAFKRETTKNVEHHLQAVAGELEPKDVGSKSTQSDRILFQPDVDSVPVDVQ